MKPKVTVFTPTYNRAHTLNRLYQSLLRQTCINFEWIVINDGSSDNTDDVIKTMIEDKEKKFKITYKKVKNGGKHRAINKAVSMAKGELFFIVDSDDYLTDDAIAIIIDKERELPQNYAGLGFNRAYTNGIISGKTFSDVNEYIDCKTTERRKYNILGDKAEVWRTDILKQFPFPSFNGENYISENVVWCQISKAGYPLRWYNKVIYVGDYLEDGLTKSKSLNEKNFLGYTFTIKTLLECDLSLIENIIWLGNYIYVGKKLKYSIKELSNKVNSSYLLALTAYMACTVKKKFKNRR